MAYVLKLIPLLKDKVSLHWMILLRLEAVDLRLPDSTNEELKTFQCGSPSLTSIYMSMVSGDAGWTADLQFIVYC